MPRPRHSSVFAFRTARRRKLHAGGIAAPSFMVLWSRKVSKSLLEKMFFSCSFFSPFIGPLACWCAGLCFAQIVSPETINLLYANIALPFCLVKRLSLEGEDNKRRYSPKLFPILLNSMFFLLRYWVRRSDCLCCCSRDRLGFPLCLLGKSALIIPPSTPRVSFFRVMKRSCDFSWHC